MFSRKQVMQFRIWTSTTPCATRLAMLERLVGEHVQMDFQPQESACPPIHADASMVEQIAMNLSVNARDAMPNGGRVSITTSLVPIRRANAPGPRSRDGNFVCLTFSDTGSGMDTQVLSRIFEPFFTTKPVGKGTGLGLATVFGIVRQHQGWLEVESKPEQGTTFRFYFPLSDRPAEKPEGGCEDILRAVAKPSSWPKMKRPCAQMVVQVLKIQGYTVLTASSGRHALGSLGTSQPNPLTCC